MRGSLRVMIPVPISALGERPKCKNLRKRYAALAKQAKNLAQQIDERENAELEEQRQAMAKHRKKREKEEEARRGREGKFVTDAEGDALKMQTAAQAEHEAARKSLGKDANPSATEGLNAAVNHVERVHKLTKSFLGSLPAEFENDHQNIPVPWSPSQRRTRNRTRGSGASESNRIPEAVR